MQNKKPYHIAVIGLGYVGLPLAIEFSKKYKVTGFDINRLRVDELLNGIDRTHEISSEELDNLKIDKEAGIIFSTKLDDISDCNVYIITVPTPVDAYNNPNLQPLCKATEAIASVLNFGDIVVYESTVYPGCTEEVCVPIIEKVSGLTINKDFHCGYSPERINPGDKLRTLTKIKKVTSGSSPKSAEEINNLYSSIIPAGTHMASSIKVAEAAKVIENAQRDINIAFVNELSKIFNLLNIDTKEVLEAASTKWNFLSFKPGLVGGHCIGVDPYYLAQKASSVGYYPEIILSGRRINDSMGGYIADQVVKLMLKKGICVIDADILILGITFKENCPDVRNTKVVDIIKSLNSYHTNLSIFDPLVSPEEVKHEYGIEIEKIFPDNKKFDAIILAVEHSSFLEIDFKQYLKETSVLYDVKGILNTELVDARL